MPLLTLSRVLHTVARTAFHAPARWIIWIARWAALLAFAYLKLTSPRERWPFHTGDDRVWYNIGVNPWLSADLWSSYRPFTVPVIHKALGHSEMAVVWFQTGLAIVSWALFADAFSRCVHRRWLSLFALIAMLGLALTSPVHNWDVIIRSESASASLLFLCLGAVLRALAPHGSGPRRKIAWAVLALVSAVWAAFARDTNSYVLVLAAGLVLAFAVIARLTGPVSAVAIGRAHASGPGTGRAFGAFFWRRADLVGAVVLAGGLLLVSTQAMKNARESHRYVFPLMNVIFQRVLPKKHKLHYFRDELGMPVSRALMQRRGKWASSDRRIAYKSPALEEFRDWLMTKGYTSYQRYLLAHPELTLQEAYRTFPRMMREDFRRLARGNAYPVTQRLDAVLVRGKTWEYPYHTVVLTFAVSAAALFFGRRRDVRLLALFGLFAVGATVSQAYICYHGDAMEVVRHAVIVGVLARVAAVTAVVLAVQAGIALLVALDPARTVARFLRALRPAWVVELRAPRLSASSPTAAR